VISLSRHPNVRLDPLTVAGAHQVEHWFDDPQVQIWLGDRSWIHRERQLITRRPGSTFRGATVLRSFGWIGSDHAGTPVAFIGGDVYDRWCRYHGEGPNGPILSDIDNRLAMGLAYLVDPKRRGHGYGQAAIQGVLRHPDAADVQTFNCGVDANNHAGWNCATAAGSTLSNPEPDHEGTLYYRWDRATAPRTT
jgi:RimJ/RimL family protein N-acetyltransferase